MKITTALLFDLLTSFFKSKGLKQTSISRKLQELKRFLNYIKRNNLDLRNMSSTDIEDYILSINNLATSTQRASNSLVSDLYKLLHRNNLILSNPILKTDIVIREKSGVKKVFTEEEIVSFLDSIETKTGFGLRDRAMFELMYVTGMRIGEIENLDIDDIDYSLKEILIREGKGDKDRIVPLGSVAEEYINRWLKKGRKGVPVSEKALFVNSSNSRLKIGRIRAIFNNYLKLSGLDGQGFSPHSIRHSCATHLLQNGAEIRYVQELLGHESIETTADYTKDMIKSIKKIHKTYHPRENELYPE